MTGPPDTSRRSVLRAGAGGLAGLAGLTSAGCVELLPPLGQRETFGRVDVPAGSDPAYRQWCPVDSAFPDDLYPPVRPHIVATPADDGSDLVGARVSLGRSLLTGALDYFGIGYDYYDLVVGFGDVTVLLGPVNPDGVEGTLVGSGYEPAGEYGEYDLYDRDDPQRTVAVADGRIVFGRGETGLAQVRAVIDTRAGEVQRRHEVDEPFADLTTRIGGRPFLLMGNIGTFWDTNGVEFSVAGMDFDADAVYWLSYARYGDGVDVPVETLRDELDDVDHASYANGVDLTTDGQVVRVHTRITHEQFRAELSNEYPPQITWSVRETDDGVRLRHEAGEATDADRLEVTTWSSESPVGGEPVDQQFADEYDVVSQGAELTVESVPEDAVHLWVNWAFDDGSGTTTVLNYDFQ